MGFRSDINFLRALSILVVMLFHFEVPFFNGGFIGVDIFFVISGFLMTKIILKGIEAGSFSLKQFYIRRISRIVPALQVLSIFILLISVVFFFVTDIRLNSKYVFLSGLFVSNIYYWRYIDYFNSHDNILLHSWSLGVEWQFYLLYPLLILLCRNLYLKRKNLFWGTIVGITFLSFLMMLKFTVDDNNFAFYMLPARLWELSIGGLAVLLGQKIRFPSVMKLLIFLLSIGLILLSVIFISPSHMWPSLYTLIPVLGTVLILALNFETEIFKARPVRFLGNISYSLYLWHWPWLIFFNYFGFMGREYIAELILISIISAFLSYRYIESNRNINLKLIGVTSLTITVFSTVLFLHPSSSLGNKLSIYKNKSFEIANYQNIWLETGKDQQFNPCNCFITNLQTTKDYDFERCLTIDPGKKNILLIGDSHAAQFSSSLRRNGSFNLIEASIGYAFPFIDSRGKDGTASLMKYIFKEYIPKNRREIDLIIISAHWLMGKNPYLSYNENEIAEEIRKTINLLKKYDISYLVIGQSEAYKMPFPKILLAQLFGRDEEEFLKKEADDFNCLLKSIIPSKNFVDIYRNKNISHLDSLNKVPYMFDANHLSLYGANQIVDKILKKRIKEKLSVYN